MLNPNSARQLQTAPKTSIYMEEWTSSSANPELSPVLFVHGGPGLYGYMGDLTEAVGRRRPAWTYFQRSMGQDPVSVETHISDLQAVMASLRARPIVVGHSWGALLAMLTLSRRPELASKVVLVGPMPFDLEGVGLFMRNIDERLTEDERRLRGERMNHLLQLTDREVRNSVFSQMSDAVFKTYHFHPNMDVLSPKLDGVDADAFFATQGDLGAKLASSDILPTFNDFPLPVEMIYGEYDPSPCARLADQLRELIPKFQARGIADCGHYPWWEGEPARGQFMDHLERALDIA